MDSEPVRKSDHSSYLAEKTFDVRLGPHALIVTTKGNGNSVIILGSVYIPSIHYLWVGAQPNFDISKGGHCNVTACGLSVYTCVTHQSQHPTANTRVNPKGQETTYRLEFRAWQVGSGIMVVGV